MYSCLFAVSLSVAATAQEPGSPAEERLAICRALRISNSEAAVMAQREGIRVQCSVFSVQSSELALSVVEGFRVQWLGELSAVEPFLGLRGARDLGSPATPALNFSITMSLMPAVAVPVMIRLVDSPSQTLEPTMMPALKASAGAPPPASLAPSLTDVTMLSQMVRPTPIRLDQSGGIAVGEAVAPVLKEAAAGEMETARNAPPAQLATRLDGVTVAGFAVPALTPNSIGQSVAADFTRGALALSSPPSLQPSGAGVVVVTNTTVDLRLPFQNTASATVDLALDSSAVAPSLQLDQAIVDAIFSEVKQGRLNQRNPELRKDLMWFVQAHAFTEEAHRVFAFLLEGSAGNTTKKKISSLFAWAQEYQAGKYASITAFYAAYHLYWAGDYAGAEAQVAYYLEDYSEYRDRIYLLQALCSAQRNQTPEALSALQRIETEFSGSPVLAEARFVRAWIHFQNNNLTEAQLLLRNLVADYPGHPSAQKAQQILDSLAERH